MIFSKFSVMTFIFQPILTTTQISPHPEEGKGEGGGEQDGGDEGEGS